MTEAPSAMPREMRAPWRMRDRMSRPSSPRPRPWLHDGPASAPSRCCFRGSWGATQGPTAAMSRKNTTTVSPATAARLRVKRRHAPLPGLVLDAGIGVLVQKVGDVLHKGGEKCHEQDRALDDGKV